jgi:8-amino-7-oxononanoate synthase
MTALEATDQKEMAPPTVIARAEADYRALEQRLGRQSGLSPFFRTLTGRGGAITPIDGQDRVMLSSSNYLGLTSHPAVTKGACKAIEEYGTAVSGSRLMNGTCTLHLRLEEELAQWLGTDDALVFASGYQSNLGWAGGLLGEEDVAIVDSANHASILDGLTLAKARMMPFRHGRLDRLEQLLGKVAAEQTPIVISDSVFSMDGDIADIPRISQVCTRNRATFVLDEAHAIGVFGPRGEGVMGDFKEAKVDIISGTLSKALASSGGFVASTASVIDVLRVKARSFLFTAALAPAAVGAALASLEICRSDEGRALQARLLENVSYLRAGLDAIGMAPTPPSVIEGRSMPSGIVSVPIGNDYHTVLAWKALYDRGIYANAALYPARPRNHGMIRMTLMATHTKEHLDRVVSAVEEMAKESDRLGEQAATLASMVRGVSNGQRVKSAQEIAEILHATN